MRVSDFNEIDDFDTEALLVGSRQRNWLWFGLIVSLALHIALCAYFYRTRFQPSVATLLSPHDTPTFKVRTVDLSPQLERNSADQTNPAAKPEPDNTQDQSPDEKKSFDKLLQDVQASTAMPDDLQNVLPEQPKVEPDATSIMTEIERSAAQSRTNDPNSLQQSGFNESPNSGRPQPALSGNELEKSTSIKRPNTFTSKIPGDSAGPNKGRNPGFSDLDQLLSQKGPLGSGTKLRLPDDQLFGYDSADLQPSAIEQLQKLAVLIKRNPKAMFTVEGYTDSLGTPEYNLDLSRRRAESVKNYLVQVMGIPEAQIRPYGYGARQFLVSPPAIAPVPGSVEEKMEIERQRPNRRVVIVVHTGDRQ